MGVMCCDEWSVLDRPDRHTLNMALIKVKLQDIGGAEQGVRCHQGYLKNRLTRVFTDDI